MVLQFIPTSGTDKTQNVQFFCNTVTVLIQDSSVRLFYLLRLVSEKPTLIVGDHVEDLSDF